MHRFKGQIIAHIGPMFGGKTSGLLSDVRKMRIAGYKVALFKPSMDIRYSENKVVNHDGESIEAINIETIYDILVYVEENIEKVDVIAIDEFQFLKGNDLNSAEMISELLELVYNLQKTLIISGLDLDSELKPFENTKEILPFATHVIKHKAVCVKCGTDATASYCKVEKDSQEKIGGNDIYEPRCLSCYFKGERA